MAKPILLGIVAILVTSLGAYMTIFMRQGGDQEKLIAQSEQIIQDNNAAWAKVNITEDQLFLSGKTIDDETHKLLVKELSKIEGLSSVTSTVEVTQPLTQEQCQSEVNTIMQSKLLFSESNTVSSESHALLLELANAVRLCPDANVLVVSHTDNLNSVADNLKISNSRSANVKSYLTEELGLNDRSIAAVGMGAAFPIVMNDSESNRNLNDRIEVIIR